MNEEPKSIWKKPWKGPSRVLVWFVLLASAVFLLILCPEFLSAKTTKFSDSIAAALIISICVSSAAVLAILFIRWLCCWRNFRRFLFGAACFVTLIVLVFSEENWRGKRAWENHKREWEAKGEKFKLSEIVPPPVPDEQNFALTPLFKPIYDFAHTPNGIRWPDTNAYQHLQQVRADLLPGGWTKKLVLGSLEKETFADLEACRDFYRGNRNYPQPEKSGTAAADILVALGKFDADLAQLHEADAARPFSRFPIKYDDEPTWSILLPHLAHMQGISILIQMRATARLEAGQTNAAFEDLKLCFRLSDSISKEPILIDHLVRLANLGIALQGVREGLIRHAWNDSQLAELEKLMAAVNLLAEYKQALRGERALNVGGLDYLRRRGSVNPDDWESGGSGPIRKAISVGFGGFFYQNMLTISRMHQEFTIPNVDEKAHQVSVENVRRGENAISELLRGRFHPYKIFARKVFPAVGRAVIRSGRMQTSVDEARIACALERYRLASGHLPDTLDALVPRFIDRIPNDVIDGQPLRYRQTGDGGYVLYSVGWNKTDDGGTIVQKKGSTPGVDINKGDWVWQLPAKLDSTQRTQTEMAEE